ncbi:MAG: hypothetical protein CML20_14750 [Rheinheimera sp.]|nr:hypothetical protein [Rheinheimera sp.]|tara:strand:- start:529 stop:1488 length:960 start_codon:yes stop_codon:yes gene_type:complete
MAKKRSMLTPTDKDPINIDELISQSNGGSFFEIDSPTRDGIKIKLQFMEFSGEDIIQKTTVLEDNERNQDWLNEKSLAPLIKAFQLSRGQTVPAVGILNDDGTVVVVAGSRRRKAAYLAGYNYKIVAGKDLTLDDAIIISKVENEKSPISLIERGERWAKIQHDNNMSFREIASQIELGSVSHTYIAIAVNGYNFPDSLKSLYPSLNCINKQVILKLKKALNYKTADEICDYITNEHSDVVENLAEEYAANSDAKSDSLTNLIVNFAAPEKKTKDVVWHSDLSLTKDKNDEVKVIEFSKPLSNEKAEKLKQFLDSLLSS